MRGQRHAPAALYPRVRPGRLRLKCDGTGAETRFRLLAKRTSPFKSAGASVQSTTGRRAVHISLQGLYCSCKPVVCSHVTLTGYPLHSLVSPSLLLRCVTVCHHISNAVYLFCRRLGVHQGRPGRVRKTSSLPGLDHRTVQPVASRIGDKCV